MTTENEIINDSLNILDQITYDNSIESFNYIDYTPQSQSNLDQRGTPIHIDINASDNYLIPSKSYLLIKGQLVRNDNNNPFAADAQITLVNNAMMYLFSEISYRVGGTDMERIRHPGQATSMLSYLSQPDDYNTSSALKSCWSKDTTNNANSSEFSPSVAAPLAGYIPAKNPQYNQGFAVRQGLLMNANPCGSFSFIIPFNHLFDFGDNKVMHNVKHLLTLTRNSTDDLAIHKANGVVPNGKINLTNITWRVPYITVETATKMELWKIIESKQIIPIAFPARSCESTIVPQTRSFSWKANGNTGIEKPRWIIVGFQSDKNRTKEQNPAVFDHLNLTNAYVTLNGEKYPRYDIANNFATNDYSVLYEMFDSFKREFYGFNSFVGGTQVNFATFKSLCPIIAFDVRHQSKKIKTTVVDIQFNFTFSDVVPADTTAYSIIISDRRFQLKSDGKNLTMLSY